MIPLDDNPNNDIIITPEEAASRHIAPMHVNHIDYYDVEGGAHVPDAVALHPHEEAEPELGSLDALLRDLFNACDHTGSDLISVDAELTNLPGYVNDGAIAQSEASLYEMILMGTKDFSGKADITRGDVRSFIEYTGIY